MRKRLLNLFLIIMMVITMLPGMGRLLKAEERSESFSTVLEESQEGNTFTGTEFTITTQSTCDKDGMNLYWDETFTITSNNKETITKVEITDKLNNDSANFEVSSDGTVIADVTKSKNNNIITLGNINAKNVTIRITDGGSFVPAVKVYYDKFISVSEITLNQSSISFHKIGRTRRLVATVAPNNASDKTITWSSSDESVASVENGVVTAIGAGTATITARAINGTTDTIEDDFTTTCNVSVTPYDNPNAGWTSVNTENGVTTYKQDFSGDSIPENWITYFYDNKYSNEPDTNTNKYFTDGRDYCKFAINNGKFQFSGDFARHRNRIVSALINLKDADEITIKYKYSGIDDYAEKYSFIARDVIDVDGINFENIDDGDNYIKGIAKHNGSGEISVTYKKSDIASFKNKLTDENRICIPVWYTGAWIDDVEIIVTRSLPVETIEIENAPTSSLTVGEDLTLTASITPENSNQTIVWSSSDDNIATVDSASGKVTSKGVGTVTITATATNGTDDINDDKADTCDITVSKGAGSISFKETSLNKAFGDGSFTNELTHTGDSAVTYDSSDKNVAIVGTDGTVTIVGTGSTNITATVEDTSNYEYATKTASYTLNVSNATMSVSATSYTGTYDKKEHGINVSVSTPTSGYKIKYGTKEGTYELDQSPTIKDVKDSPFTVYYKVSANNYNDVTGSATVTINKANPTLTAVPYANTLTYNEKAQELITAGTTEDGELKYSLDGETYSTDIPKKTDPGKYTVYYKVFGDSNHNDLENTIEVQIFKRNATDEMKSASVELKAVIDKTATVEYTLPDSASYGTVTNNNSSLFSVDTSNGIKLTTLQDETATWPNPVTFTVKVKDAATYNDYDLTITVNPIFRQEQTITAQDVTVTYGDTDKSVSGTTTGDGKISYAVKEEDKDYISVDASSGALTIKKVPTSGKATVVVTAARTDDYSLATKDVTVTIKKADITPTVEIEGWTYGDKQNSPSVTGNDGNGTVKYTYKKGESEVDKPINAGDYTVTASITETENYNSGTATKDFTIAQRDINEATLVFKNNTGTIVSTDPGKAVGPEISVEWNMTVLENDTDYALTGQVTSSQYGTHEIIVKGVNNFTGEISTSWRLINESDAEEDSENTIKTSVNESEDAPELTASGLTVDLVKELLTEEETSQVGNGQSAILYLQVDGLEEDEVDELDKKQAETFASNNRLTLNKYFDVTLYLQVGTNKARRITDTGTDKLKVTISVPDEIKNSPSGFRRRFTIYRIHDGVAQKLAETYDTKIVIEANKFSTYVIAYNDIAIPRELPKTGITSNDQLLTFLLPIGLVGLLGACLFLDDKKKYKK